VGGFASQVSKYTAGLTLPSLGGGSLCLAIQRKHTREQSDIGWCNRTYAHLGNIFHWLFSNIQVPYMFAPFSKHYDTPQRQNICYGLF
jgi:hypothetical protein